MPTFHHFRYWKKESIADGSTASDYWQADDNYIIRRIFIQNASGAGLTASTFYFKIGERVYTRPEVPATVLGPDIEVSPILNIPITKGEKLDWTFKNQEGSTISVLITFEVWKP